jgi:hypothetical protein
MTTAAFLEASSVPKARSTSRPLSAKTGEIDNGARS